MHVRLAAFLLAIALVAATCSPDAARDPEPRPRAQQTAGVESTGGLIYVHGTTLFRYDLETKERTRITELPSADVALSLEGTSFVVVEEQSGEGSTAESFRMPVLLMGTIARPGDTVELGPGRSPAWSPDGDHIAAIEEIEGYSICPVGSDDEKSKEKGCVTGERIVVYDALGGAAQQATTALGANRWSLLGWVDGSLLGIGLTNQIVALGAPGDTHEEVRHLGVPPREMWGGSPTEPLFLLVSDGEATFIDGDGDVRSNADLSGSTLGDGAWSPDGRAVVAALIGHKRSSSSLILIDVDSGDVRRVPGSRGATGNVVWAPDASAFAYARTPRGRPRRLEAVRCTADLKCESLFKWKQGLSLLALD